MKSHTHTQQGTFGSGGPSTDSTGGGGVDHTHSINHSHNVSVSFTMAAYGGSGAIQQGGTETYGSSASGSTSSISTSTSGGATAYNHTHSLSNHTHSTTISGQTSSNDLGATETRPVNYTYIIWKRIA